MDIYRALSCGINPNQNNNYFILKTLSLWHLLVVSGSHLVVLDFILNFTFKNFTSEKNRFYLKLFVFIGFAFMTGLQAPLLRAIFQVLIAKINQFLKLNLSSSEIVLWSGVLCLIFFPYLCSSLSLQLSWMASLILSHFSNKNLLSLHTLIYIFILPVIATLQIPHPVSIFYNLIFGPLLSIVLFPMSLVLIVLPCLSFITDHFIDFLLFALNITANEFEPLSKNSIIPNNNFLLWVFIIALNMYFVHSNLKPSHKVL
jgi:ComEC/Rec2-related protein